MAKEESKSQIMYQQIVEEGAQRNSSSNEAMIKMKILT